MNYYLFKFHPEEMRVVPQSQKMKHPYDFLAPDSLWNLVAHHGKRGFVPNTGTILLEYHAKRTDILSVVAINSNCAILASPRLFDLIQTFPTEEYETTPARVEHRKKEYVYYLLRFPFHSNQFVDYKHSKFRISGDQTPTGMEPVEIDTYETYCEIQERLNQEDAGKPANQRRNVCIELLYLDTNRIDLHLFRLYKLSFGFIVSEALKTAIENAGLTGMQFEPVKALP